MTFEAQVRVPDEAFDWSEREFRALVDEQLDDIEHRLADEYERRRAREAMAA